MTEEVLGQTCIDGGKCHHACKEQCFRRQYCVPFDNYRGDWKHYKLKCVECGHEQEATNAWSHGIRLEGSAFRYCDQCDGVVEKLNVGKRQEEEMTAKDIQVGGSHYKDMAIQPIEYVLKNKLGFCEGNVVKYVSRWRNKGGVDDLRKAKHYLDLLIEESAWVINMGLRPKPNNLEVEVKLKDGSTVTGKAGDFNWSLSDDPSDIDCYRVFE